MSILRRLFGRDSAGVDLPALREHLAGAVALLERKTIDPDLVRAQLADHYRDVGVAPVAPERFEALTNGLDEEGWRRLALAVSALRLRPVRDLLPHLPDGDVGAQVERAFVGVARGLPLLTLDLLHRSPLRLEEFARAWLAALGAPIQGETPEVSKERLTRLDYARLLDEADRARRAAEDRLAYLKKLQDEADARARPRGKW